MDEGDRSAMPTESFPIVPSNPKTMLFIGVVLAAILTPALFAWTKIGPPGVIALPVLVLVGAVLAYSGASSRRVQFEVSPEGLRIRRSLFGRFIPRDELLLGGARPADLVQEKDLRPFLRTFGAGLVGYSEGWFLLRNREKALAFLTDRTRVALLPTRTGYNVMLSVEDPRAFLQTAARVWG
jgi:Bacterial PH domain